MEKYVENRPWGNFEQFCHNEVCTVKLLNVNPGSELSYQYHHHREEFWRVVKGSAEIIIDDKVHKAKEGDEFFIKTKAKHRIRTTDSAVTIMEISFGKFDENDIVRIEDKYNRIK